MAEEWSAKLVRFLHAYRWLLDSYVIVSGRAREGGHSRGANAARGHGVEARSAVDPSRTARVFRSCGWGAGGGLRILRVKFAHSAVLGRSQVYCIDAGRRAERAPNEKPSWEFVSRSRRPWRVSTRSRVDGFIFISLARV